MFDWSTPEIDKIEKRLAEAMNGADFGLEAPREAPRIPGLSPWELLQMTWERAEQEVDELRTELRIMRQRQQAAKRDLIARIN